MIINEFLTVVGELAIVVGYFSPFIGIGFGTWYFLIRKEKQSQHLDKGMKQ